MLQLAHIDWSSSRPWIRVAIGVAVTGLVLLMYASERDRIRKAFAGRWQIDQSVANHLYAERHGALTTGLTWLMLIGLLFMVDIILPLAVLTDANDLRTMGFTELYLIPALVIVMGGSVLLMPSRDLAYGLRMRRLKPGDLPPSPTFSDFHAALTAAPPRFYGLRLLGFLMLALGCALVWGELAYHVHAWLDKTLPGCVHCQPFRGTARHVLTPGGK